MGDVAERPQRVKLSITVSPFANYMLDDLMDQMGIYRSQIIEIAIRRYFKEEMGLDTPINASLRGIQREEKDD